MKVSHGNEERPFMLDEAKGSSLGLPARKPAAIGRSRNRGDTFTLVADVPLRSEAELV